MVVFDTTTLLVALVPPELVRAEAKGVPIPDARQRVDHLIASLAKDEKIIVPTPALAEAMVRAGAEPAQQYVDRMSKSAAFEIADFDTIAALEAAELARQALASPDRRGGTTGPRQKVKVDRQIVAIAIVRGAHTIYSNDDDIEKIGKSAGIAVVGLEQLPLPPAPAPRAPDLMDFANLRREIDVGG